MNPQEAEKLLGGYAAGILSPEERSALFAAAAANQPLFDALADEEELRDLMADPAARAELLRAVSDPEPMKNGWSAWLRPAAPSPAAASAEPARSSGWSGWWRIALPAVGALGIAAIGFVMLKPARNRIAAEAPVQTAAVRTEPEPALARKADVQEPAAAERRADVTRVREEAAAAPSSANATQPVLSKRRDVARDGPDAASGVRTASARERDQEAPRSVPPAAQSEVAANKPEIAPPASVVTRDSLETKPASASQPRPAPKPPQAQGAPVIVATPPPIDPQEAMKLRLVPGAAARLVTQPLALTIERRDPDGVFRPARGEFEEGDAVRITATAPFAGRFRVAASNGFQQSGDARAGQVLRIPSEGILPSRRGSVTISVEVVRDDSPSAARGEALITFR